MQTLKWLERVNFMTINYKRAALLIGILSSSLLLFYFSIPILYPFYISILLAMIILPLARFLEKTVRFSRGLSILTTLLIVMLGSFTLLTIGIIEFVQFLQQFSQHVPRVFDTFLQRFYDDILPWYEQLTNSLTNLLSKSPEASQNYLMDMFVEFSDSLRGHSQQFIMNFIESLVLFLTSILQSSYVFIIILLSTYFLAKDGPQWLAAILSKLPTSFTRFIDDLKGQGTKVLKKYVLAQLLIVVLSGIIIWIGLTILNVEHALAIALFSMLLDFIPLIGISIVFLPWIIYLFITQDFSMTIGLSILLIVLVIFRNIIEPKLIGSSLGIHPFIMIVFLFVLFQFFGVVGILLAPIFLVLFITIKETDIAKNLQTYLTTKNTNR